jgi:hypothetical protein
MKTTLAALLLTSLFAHATNFDLASAVAQDIQALVADTVNEGEQTAQVVYRGKIPAVECRLSDAKETSRKWAQCRVSFTVSFEGEKEVRTCSVLYSFNPRSAQADLQRGNEQSFRACIETLSESF